MPKQRNANNINDINVKNVVTVTKKDNTKEMDELRGQQFRENIAALRLDPQWRAFMSAGRTPVKIKELQNAGNIKALQEFINQKRIEFNGGQKSVLYTEFLYNKKKLK